MLSYPTSTLSQLGQPVWYRYNSQSGRSVPHEYNNISAGLGWPVWIGFLSTWVVRMVRVNSTERCDGQVRRGTRSQPVTTPTRSQVAKASFQEPKFVVRPNSVIVSNVCDVLLSRLT